MKISTFHKFRDAAALLRVNRQKMLRIVGRFQSQTLASSFGGWQRYVAENNRMGSVLARILKRMQQAQFVGAWNTWVEFVSEKNKEAVIIKRVMSRIINRCISSAFETWKDLVKTMRGLRRLLRRMLLMQLASAFSSWYESAMGKKEFNQTGVVIIERLKARMRMSLVSSVFGEWSSVAAQRLWHSRMLAKHARRTSRSTLRTTFSSWSLHNMRTVKSRDR